MRNQYSLFNLDDYNPVNPVSDASLDRLKACNEIIFSVPYVGKTGATLCGYVWSHKKIEYIDARGEDRIKNVSDWENAILNIDTNRQIVHQFYIEDTNKNIQLVSAESAAKLLGIGEGAVRENAKKLLDREIVREKSRLQDIEFADRLDRICGATSPSHAISALMTTYFVKSEMIKRMAANGDWHASQNRIERDSRAHETYHFLVRDNHYIWSPEPAVPNSEMFKRGWRNEDLRAWQIWPDPQIAKLKNTGVDR
jgi:hypothetical protein